MVNSGLLAPDFPVRAEGVEPTRVASPDPKSGASASFATPAKKERESKQIFYFKRQQKQSVVGQFELFEFGMLERFSLSLLHGKVKKETRYQ